MKVDRVCLEDVIAVYCCGVNVLVEFVGVERGVVKVADGKEYGVGGRRQEASSPAHKVLREDHLCGKTKVEAMALAPVAGGPAATLASRAWGVVAVVIGRHCYLG